MKRIEIILNEAVESDLLNLFTKDNAISFYTRIPNVHGQGYSVPKKGDEIWPQQNVLYIIYCDDETVETIVTIAKKLREQYPDDGIAIFAVEAENLIGN